MSEPESPADEPSVAGDRATTAGAMLRAAREAQGLHIAALATAIKVTPRKLEALESDRLQDLPDATFARALAQTVCRHLKIDPKPVLALLPAHGSISLEPSTRIQSTPYRDRGSRSDQGLSARSLGPLVWAAALLLVAAAAVVLVPGGWWQQLMGPAPAPAAATAPVVAPAVPQVLPEPPAASAAQAVTAPASAGTANAASPAEAAAVAGALKSVEAAASSTAAPVPSPPPADAARDRPSSTETVFAAPPTSAGAAPSVGGVLVVTTTDASWVEVRDAKGRTLLSETVQPGRTVGLDGPLPLRLLVGNAAATQLVFMGRPVDVMARSRENVARFELQ